MAAPAIQAVDPADAARVCDVILRGLPQCYGRERDVRRLADDAVSMRTYAAKSNDLLVGFVTVHQRRPRDWEIHAIGVEPEWQRKGIGRALMQAAEQHLVREGASTLFVNVATAVQAAPYFDGMLGFYQSLGFYRSGSWERANPRAVGILLVKEFGPNEARSSA